MEIQSIFLWILAAFTASTIASVSGFGGAAILLPVTVAMIGVQAAVPILTIAQLTGNLSRVVLNRAEISWPVVRWFSVGGIPGAITGSCLFAYTSQGLLKHLIGVLLISFVVCPLFLPKRSWTFPRWGFLPIGILSGFFSGLLGSIGPLVAPFFLAHGLQKSRYIGTEACAALVLHLTKSVVYGQLAVLKTEHWFSGLMLAPAMVLGTVCGLSLIHI